MELFKTIPWKTGTRILILTSIRCAVLAFLLWHSLNYRNLWENAFLVIIADIIVRVLHNFKPVLCRLTGALFRITQLVTSKSTFSLVTVALTRFISKTGTWETWANPFGVRVLNFNVLCKITWLFRRHFTQFSFNHSHFKPASVIYDICSWQWSSTQYQ